MVSFLGTDINLFYFNLYLLPVMDNIYTKIQNNSEYQSLNI